MPKPLKKPQPKRPARRRPAEPDANQLAYALIERLDKPEAGFKSQLSAYMSQLGRRGGLTSGKRRMQNLTPEQRQAIALKAARARWAKAKRPKP